MGDNHTDPTSTPGTDSTPDQHTTDPATSGSAPPGQDTTPVSGTVIVEGDPITVDADTTVADLKDMAGVKDLEKAATYVDGDDLRVLNEQDPVLEKVPDGETISFQPVEGNLFG